MIDTCGLPMKFEFRHICTHYIVDFYSVDERGFPLLINLSTGKASYSNPATRYANMIKDGTWTFLREIFDVKPVDVEDLL